MYRAVCTIIRLVAGALFVFGGMQIGLEFMRHRLKQAELSVGHCVTGGILTALGIILFALSSRVAAQLTDDDGNDDEGREDNIEH